ncbi:MAG: tetratricopeptide repeat protein, partial [Xanthomonadaceae bacterium]|nr:tetratricopeptide repeat protein [Xanthomonadaceae bacterium]
MSAPDADLSRHAIKLYQSGNFGEAEKLYRRLQSRDPDNWQYALLLGLCRHGLGDVDGAFEKLRRAVELGDGQPATHYYYGRLLTDSMQPGLAREQFAQAVALDPNHVEARTALGLVSLMTGDFKRATGELKTALRASDSHVPALAALARALIEQDEIEAAYPHALKAVKLDPQSVVAQNSLGRVFHLQGQLDFSLQCFDNALALKPDSGELNAGKA